MGQAVSVGRLQTFVLPAGIERDDASTLFAVVDLVRCRIGVYDGETGERLDVIEASYMREFAPRVTSTSSASWTWSETTTKPPDETVGVREPRRPLPPVLPACVTLQEPREHLDAAEPV